MNKTNENQRGVLTDIGQQKINAHAAAGTKLIISQFVIGDGNGQPVEPIKSATALTHEIGREPITETTTHVVSGGIFMSPEMALKYQGQWIREAGLVDSEGDLIVWCSYAPTLISQFTERQIMINIPILSSDTVSIVIDATKKWVTQEQLDTKLDKTATAENSKLLNGKTAEELMGGEWTFIRELKWPLNNGAIAKGALLGTVADVLKYGFKVIGYNRDGERVWLGKLWTVGNSERTPRLVSNNWNMVDVWARDGRADISVRYNSDSVFALTCKRSTWIFGGSPRKQMMLSVIPSNDEPEFGSYSTSYSFGGGHALFDLARAGFSKSDDLYVFFRAESGLFQVIDNIKIYKRNS